MPHCPHCGNETREEMTFCQKCGASLKAGQASAQTAHPVSYRHEKEEKKEKSEKQEKGEKTEKREKHEQAFIGPLIGGLVLIFIGLAAYLQLAGLVDRRIMGALFFVIIGIAIILGAIYGAMLTKKRYPRT